MEIKSYISLLNNPSQISETETLLLKDICTKYPYFQSAKSLYLKALYIQRSFAYNKELKKVAAITTDRDILFDFIVSNSFTNYQPLDIKEIEVVEEDVLQTQKNEPTLNENIEKTVLETLVYIENPDKETNLINKIDAIAQKKAESIVSITEQNNKNYTVSEIEKELEIGTPLDFSQDEKHSFSQWLKLTKMKPICREDTQTKSSNTSTEQITRNTSIEITPISKTTSDTEEKKKKKLEIIDRFIEANPKITPSKTAPVVNFNIEDTEPQEPYYMTETLAKIYLEQKKYQKAIQAYEILILKYPEKSSLFAKKISHIKELQQYNNL